MFWGHRNPWLISGLLAVTAAYRATLGEWRWWDLGSGRHSGRDQPFAEWVIHVYVLHAKPVKVFGRRYDSMAARKHREHHTDPRRIEWIFVPLSALFQLFAIIVSLSFLPHRQRRWLSPFSRTLTMLLTYEWTHYLIHLALPAEEPRLPPASGDRTGCITSRTSTTGSGSRHPPRTSRLNSAAEGLREDLNDLPDARSGSPLSQSGWSGLAEGGGLEPPSPFGRRFSRPFGYQLP